jgi:hypothetical protein
MDLAMRKCSYLDLERKAEWRRAGEAATKQRLFALLSLPPLALCKPSGTGVPVSCGLVDLFIDNKNRINHFIKSTLALQLLIGKTCYPKNKAKLVTLVFTFLKLTILGLFHLKYFSRDFDDSNHLIPILVV